jgi:hypothetical protein
LLDEADEEYHGAIFSQATGGVTESNIAGEKERSGISICELELHLPSQGDKLDLLKRRLEAASAAGLHPADRPGTTGEWSHKSPSKVTNPPSHLEMATA